MSGIRLGEELLAALRFRYRLRLGGFEEVVLRDGSLDASTFLRRVDDPSELPLVEEVAATIRRWAERADVIVSPLGVGDHLDHQIVAEAARRLGAAGRQVVFYEDRPYTAWADPSEPARVAALLDERLERRVISEPISRAKHRRLFYPSQISADFRQAAAADESGDRVEAVWALPDAPWPPRT